MLVYVPTSRVSALAACAHRFFDELRHPGFCLPGGQSVPPLFNFSDSELQGATEAMREKLVPPHARQAGWSARTAMANAPPPHDAAAFAAAYAEAYPKAPAAVASEAPGARRAGGDATTGGGGGGSGRGEAGGALGHLVGGDGPLGGAAAGAAQQTSGSLGGSQRGVAKSEAPALPGERRSP
jgi:hypothetical protein